MKTKKDLIQENKEIIDKAYWAKREFDKFKDESAIKNRDLSTEIENVKRESADRSRLLNLIVEILAGEASTTSKTEVLIDMLPEVAEKIQSRATPNTNYPDLWK